MKQEGRYQIFFVPSLGLEIPNLRKKTGSTKISINWIGLHGTTPSKKNKLDGGLVDWQSGEDLYDKLIFFGVLKTQFENTTSEVLPEFFRWKIQSGLSYHANPKKGILFDFFEGV